MAICLCVWLILRCYAKRQAKKRDGPLHRERDRDRSFGSIADDSRVRLDLTPSSAPVSAQAVAATVDASPPPASAPIATMASVAPTFTSPPPSYSAAATDPPLVLSTPQCWAYVANVEREQQDANAAAASPTSPSEGPASLALSENSTELGTDAEAVLATIKPVPIRPAPALVPIMVVASPAAAPGTAEKVVGVTPTTPYMSRLARARSCQRERRLSDASAAAAAVAAYEAAADYKPTGTSDSAPDSGSDVSSSSEQQVADLPKRATTSTSMASTACTAMHAPAGVCVEAPVITPSGVTGAEDKPPPPPMVLKDSSRDVRASPRLLPRRVRTSEAAAQAPEDARPRTPGASPSTPWLWYAPGDATPIATPTRASTTTASPRVLFPPTRTSHEETSSSIRVPEPPRGDHEFLQERMSEASASQTISKLTAPRCSSEQPFQYRL